MRACMPASGLKQSVVLNLGEMDNSTDNFHPEHSHAVESGISSNGNRPKGGYPADLPPLG